METWTNMALPRIDSHANISKLLVLSLLLCNGKWCQGNGHGKPERMRARKREEKRERESDFGECRQRQIFDAIAMEMRTLSI